jgi:hypothetical protein
MLDMFAQYLVDRLGEARTQAGIEAVLGLFSECMRQFRSLSVSKKAGIRPDYFLEKESRNVD